MRIGLVTTVAEQKGGVERKTLGLLEASRQLEGVDYSVLFLEGGPMVEEVRAMGYPTHVLEAGRLREPVPFVRTVHGVRRWLRAEGVDAAMSMFVKAHLYVGPAAWPATPALWWQNNVPSGHWMERVATAVPAAGVFCNSRLTERAQGRLRPPRPTRVVHSPVDLGRFDPERLPPPAEARARLGLSEVGPLVGIVARLERWKGVDHFLRAAARVAEAVPSAHFAVVGGEHWADPEHPAELERVAREGGVLGRVRFAGHQTDVPMWMQAMDVVVHASQNEPFGTVVLEAMALGKPLIAAKEGGPLEVVEDGENGFLVPYGDADGLARVVVALLGDEPLRRRLGARARARALRSGTGAFAEAVAAGARALLVAA